jgi:dihydroxyacetone kinase
MKRGAEAVLKMLEERKLLGEVVVDVGKIVQVVEFTMDGTSGALYTIFLNSLVYSLRQQATEVSVTEASPKSGLAH